MRRMMMRLATAAVLVGGMVAAGRAEAAFITIDNPNPVIPVPTSGPITITFTGKISFDPGFTEIIARGAFIALNATGQGLGPTSFGPDMSAALNGGTYSGVLMTFTINPGTAPGLYNRSPGSPNGMSLFTISADSGPGSTSPVTLQANYSITIGPAAVPEPASALLVGLGLVGVGWSVRRRSPRVVG